MQLCWSSHQSCSEVDRTCIVYGDRGGVSYVHLTSDSDADLLGNSIQCRVLRKAWVRPDPRHSSKCVVCLCLDLRRTQKFFHLFSPRGLTFTWWGCYGLCLRHKPTELAHSFHSVLVSVSVFMALSPVIYSINSPNNSPLSHSVLPVLFLPCCSFKLYISL